IVFAVGLGWPRALAFDPAGHLYVTEEDDPGRLLRFRAPATPVVAWPAVTALSPAVLSGQAEPGSRVSLAFAGGLATVLAPPLADPAAGAFSLAVPLQANAANALTVLATGAAGRGLTGLPASLTVLHDDRLPVVTILAPGAGAAARGDLVVEAAAADAGS